jgi:Tol biopolymer transport system component
MKVSGSLLAMLPTLAFLLASACGDGEQPAATPASTTTPASTEEPADATPSPAATATPSPTAAARIAFTSDRDGNGEIYAMNADGSGLTRLTNSPAFDSSPTWSPDGSRIAFGSGFEIYVMNADGSGLANLTNDPAEEGHLGFAWSPDGSRIVFSSNRDGVVDVYVMNADGSGLTRLTDEPADDGPPAWSPVQ